MIVPLSEDVHTVSPLPIVEGKLRHEIHQLHCGSSCDNTLLVGGIRVEHFGDEDVNALEKSIEDPMVTASHLRLIGEKE